MVHTDARLPIFRYAKTGQTTCWRLPPIPGKAALRSYRTLHKWSDYAPLQALKVGWHPQLKEYLPLFESIQKMRSRPVRDNEKLAAGDAFPGYGLRHTTSVLQECVRLCPACRDCFRWELDCAAYENSPGMRGINSHAGATIWNDRRPFSEVQVNNTKTPRFCIRRGPFCPGFEALFFRFRNRFFPSHYSPTHSQQLIT